MSALRPVYMPILSAQNTPDADFILRKIGPCPMFEEICVQIFTFLLSFGRN